MRVWEVSVKEQEADRGVDVNLRHGTLRAARKSMPAGSCSLTCLELDRAAPFGGGEAMSS
jgi:hypothetical protein